jgi:cell division protein FtsQ
MTQSSTRNRSPEWDEDAPAEPRLRRMRQGVPPSGYGLPVMPPEMDSADGGDSSRPFRTRFDGSHGLWRWPTSAAGRVFAGLGFLILLGGLAAASLVLKTYLGRDARFRIAGVDNIDATGLTEVSRAELLPVFGEDVGKNVFFIDLAERRKQLEQIPWVERATVMRLLPDRIRVQVVERQPVAFVRQGQQIGLVDASGVLLTMPAAMMAQHHYSFPVVTGIDPLDPAPARKARMAVYGRLLGELDANGQKLSEQISEIDLTDPEDARVSMPEPGGDVLAHFGEDRFMERYQRYKAHIAEWRQLYPRLVAVDLRYDQQAVLEMAQGAAPVQAAVTDPAAKPGDAAPASAGTLQTADSKPLLAAKTGAAKPASGKPAAAKAIASEQDATAKSLRASNKAEGRGAAKPKAMTKAEKNKLRDKIRAAEEKRTALNRNRRKSVPPTHPAATMALGQ